MTRGGLAGVLAASIACCAALAGAAEPAVAELGALFDARAGDGFSGVVILARGDEVLLERAWGAAGCTGAEPMTLDHVFLIGSITKTFTRAAVYALVGQGKLSLDDLISAHLPGVPADKAAITVEQVATHRAGLADIIDEEGNAIEYTVDWDYLPTTRDEIVARGMRSELIFEPGTDRKYSNLGYALLAAMVEHVSGESYEAFVRENVLLPAGMRRTGYVLPDWSGARFAHGCRGGKTWEIPYTAGRWMDDGPSWNLRGNGGMLGTAGDLLAWLAALDRGAILGEDVFESFMDAITGTSRTFEERATAGAGGNGIFNSYYLWLLESDLRLVMISNAAEHQVESYLEEIYPLLMKLR